MSDANPNLSDLIIGVEAAIRESGLPRSSFFQRRQAGRFPEPVRLGLRSVAWPRKQIEEWRRAELLTKLHGS